jgi:hypothetical protein
LRLLEATLKQALQIAQKQAQYIKKLKERLERTQKPVDIRTAKRRIQELKLRLRVAKCQRDTVTEEAKR